MFACLVRLVPGGMWSSLLYLWMRVYDEAMAFLVDGPRRGSGLYRHDKSGAEGKHQVNYLNSLTLYPV